MKSSTVAAVIAIVLASGCHAPEITSKPDEATRKRVVESIASTTINMDGEGVLKPRSSDIGCVRKYSAPIQFGGPDDRVVATYVSEGKDCGGIEGVALAIISPRAGLRLLEYGDKLETGFVGKGPYGDQVDELLKNLISAAPFPASRLPAWSADDLEPAFADGLTVEQVVNRETYETVRRRNDPIFCWMPTTNMLSCAVAAPRQHRGIKLFRVYGFQDLGSRTGAGNVAILTKAG